MTAWAQLQNYNVRWAHTVNVVVQMDVHRETRDLLPNELKLVVMQRVIPGDPDSPRQPRLGEVYLNLAEYADAGPVTRRYLLRQSKTNATLRLTIELEHIGGEKNYKPPPLRKGEILASVSGLLSNNSLLNTRLARELDLYIGDDVSTVGELAHPYADANGHIDADKLASSFGLRTTENLIEALFNPVPSASAVPTPFTYYAPPKTVEPDESLSSDSLSNSTEVRSMGSGGDSASYAASISSAEAQLSAGLADGHRHWWQKKRSRPGTPIMRNGRPPTPGQPVPVREG
ncbi:hypothetical protein A0H81_03003 [Grifola frondosa]|uniref:C2 NT-type domain-containing protein n=1 Tax=Grifola frondosa TaxID=5627 RepID=A0A1C7MH42_GRIFR|nr:hypothetical protein A0H81_03003 [Grifola frondosa]